MRNQENGIENVPIVSLTHTKHKHTHTQSRTYTHIHSSHTIAIAAQWRWNEMKEKIIIMRNSEIPRSESTERKNNVSISVSIFRQHFSMVSISCSMNVIVLQSPLNYSHPSTFRRTNVHAFEHTNSTVCFSATPWFFFLVTKGDEKSVYIFSMNIYVHYLIFCHTVSHSHNQTGHKQEQMKRNERTNGMNEKKKTEIFRNHTQNRLCEYISKCIYFDESHQLRNINWNYEYQVHRLFNYIFFFCSSLVSI